MFTDLTEMIREALAAHPNEQPAGLAKIIVDEVRERAVMKAFLQELMEGRIKDIIRIDGNRARTEALQSHSSNRPANWSPKMNDRNIIHQQWQRMLESRVNINGELKRTGSCTREDLVFCVKRRQALISHIEAQIAHFEYLISLLDQYQVATLDEVPEQTL